MGSTRAKRRQDSQEEQIRFGAIHGLDSESHFEEPDGEAVAAAVG